MTASQVYATLIALRCFCGGSGCTPPSSTYQLRVAGSGVLMPSSGPSAIGPLNPARHGSLEGSLSENLVSEASGVPVLGAGSASAINTVARGRAAYSSANNLEVGLSVQVSHSRWSTESSRGAIPSAIEGQTLWGGGFQMRGMVLGNRSFGLGLLGEVSLYQAPYAQHVELNTVTDSGSSSRTREVAATTVLMASQGGLFWVFSPRPELQVTVGSVVGLRDTVRSSYFTTTTCTGYLSGDCERRAQELPSPFEVAPQWTGFISAGYAIGRVTLLGQVAVNAVGDSPLSGTLGARVTP